MNFLPALVVYILAMIAIGFHSARKGTGLSHYFVANRDLGLISTASTTTATTVGGSATITSVIMIYNYGLTGIWIDLAGGLGLITLGFVLAGRVRATGVYSLPELVEHFYNREARVTASVLIIAAEIAWIALLMQALKYILSSTTDLNPEDALIVSAFIFIVYTFIGGQYAVAYSDVIQLVIMVVGICFLAGPIALMDAGGLDAITSQGSDKLSFPVSDGQPFKEVFPLFLMIFLPHLVGSDIYSKVLSARTPTIARNGVLIAGVLKIIFGITMVVLAFSAMEIFATSGSDGSPISAGEVLPRLIQDVLPSWVAVLVLIAFAGVMMSSADSCLLTGSTTFANDIFRFFRKEPKDRELVMAARAMVIILGVLGYWIAVEISDIIDTLKLGYTIFSSSLILPVIFGFYKHRFPIPSSAAIAGMIAGGLTSVVWMYLVDDWYPSLVEDIDPMIAGITACAVAIGVVTLIHRIRSSPPQPST
jgi:solute:Na+ symporter, SSS family